MNLFADAVTWLNDPLNWQGRTGVPYLAWEHLYITAAAVGLASLVALPLAAWLGHTGRGGGLTVMTTNVSRAIPTLALLTLLPATPIGFGNRATIVALAIFAVPPVLANAYVGVRGVDRDVVDAARGMGLSEAQILRRVELPLALPLLAAGLRTATVQVLATATLAALVGGGGLGRIINLGFSTSDYGQTLAGGLLVAVLVVTAELGMAQVQRRLAPGRARRPPRRRRQLATAAS